MRNMYAVTCDSCGKHFKKPAGPGPHWCGCPWDWLKECPGCGSSFMAVTNQAEEVCSVQCKVAVAACNKNKVEQSAEAFGIVYSWFLSLLESTEAS